MPQPEVALRFDLVLPLTWFRISPADGGCAARAQARFARSCAIMGKSLAGPVAPGARTAWHSHPLGQTLIVMAGCGRVQRWGDHIEEIRPGDVIWAPPGEKHWHGAAPTTAVMHIAIQEHLDGKTAGRMEKVSDEQYQA